MSTAPEYFNDGHRRLEDPEYEDIKPNIPIPQTQRERDLWMAGFVACAVLKKEAWGEWDAYLDAYLTHRPLSQATMRGTNDRAEEELKR